MTATAPKQENPHERSEAESLAWDAYRDALRDLEGREYEEAEEGSWERLQARLREIAREHGS